MKHKFSYRIAPRRGKPNKKGGKILTCRLTLHNRHKEFSLGLSIKPPTWDAIKQLTSGEDSTILNKKLIHIKNELESIHFELEKSGKPYTVETIYDRYKGIIKDDYLVIDLIERFINWSLAMEQAGEIKYGAIKAYKKFKHRFEDFLKWLGYEDHALYFSDMSMKTMKDYVFFAKTVKKHSNNYIAKTVEFYKQVFKFAIQNEWVKTNPIAEFSHKRSRPKEPIYLTPSELEILSNYRYYSPALQKVADLFIIQCYTGVSYADLMSLSSENLYISDIDGKQWLRISRQKTGTVARLPLLAPVLRVIAKYGIDDLPKITNQKYNFYLKEIAQVLGIKKKLTTHIGRKTFGTLALNHWGVPLETVSYMLGHSDVKVTLNNYARVQEKRVAEDMKNVQQFKSPIITEISKLEKKKYGKD